MSTWGKCDYDLIFGFWQDYDFHKGPSEYEDILQCNNLPSSQTPRGHQSPAAFLIMASGLDKVWVALSFYEWELLPLCHSLLQALSLCIFIFLWFFCLFLASLCVCVHALLLVCFSTVHCYIYTLISIHPHIKFIYFCSWFQHGIDSNQPYPYSHLDIAGSSGPFPGIPTGSPILAFAAQYVLPRLPWKAADMD